MMIAGKYDGKNSRARIRVRSLVLLLEIVFVIYAAGSGWTQERIG